jgi:hypothetical protein
MRRNPGMKFRVQLPHFLSIEDRGEFEKLNPQRF